VTSLPTTYPYSLTFTICSLASLKPRQTAYSNDGVSRDIPGRPGRSNTAGQTNCLHPPPKAGNNDVAVPSHTTSDKDDAADKKRKAIEAVSSTPDAQRHKTTDAAPDAPHCATKAANNGVAGDNNDAAQLKPPPASDKIEDWLDDEAAMEQGFIRTGRKPYRPPLPNLYTGPALDDDLLDGHDWLYKEHGKALWHTKDPIYAPA
jgi:hypothetical protein